MKYILIAILLTLTLSSCSKKAATSTAQSRDRSSSPAVNLPFQPVITESPEEKEIKSIKHQADVLFESGNFDALEALTKKFRVSKECYADGTWKLFYVYKGLELSDDKSDADWTNRLTTLRNWVNAKPNSVTAPFALAENLVDYAWKARGEDYANKVSDDKWRLFFQRLSEAVNVLNQAKSLKEQSPFWWHVLLRAEHGLQVKRTSYDASFNAAIRAYPEFSYYYCSRANYLLPRWYGAKGEWESDLTKSADKIGGDNGDVLYARVVWFIHEEIYSKNIFKDYNLSWDRVNRGFEVLEKQFPDNLAVENEAAHLAVLARDENSAKKYFDQTQGKIDISSWGEKEDYIRFAKLVYGCAP